MVIGHRGIGEPVKRGEPVHVVPYLLQIRMENVGPVLVHMDSFYIFRVHISPDLGPLVNDKYFLSRFFRFMGKYSSK